MKKNNHIAPMDYAKYKYIYTADFETSTEAWQVDKARVWAWDICDLQTYSHRTGNDIDTFFDYLYSISKRGYKSIIVGFHNLCYDGIYIIDYLLTHGYTTSGNKDNLEPKQFYTLITKFGQHYQYVVNMGRAIGYKHNFHIIFVDTLKTIHKSVKDIAEAYKLPIQKGHIDYDLVREVGHKLTTEEELYIHYDTEIVARALKIQFDQGFTKVTQPANALSHYKHLIGNKEYEALFPNDDTFTYARQAYYGGMCWANPKYIGKELHNLYSFDINSMYPASMIHYYLPYGYSEYKEGNVCEGLPPNKLAVQKIRCSYDLKPDCVPSLFKSRFNLSLEKHSTTSNNMIEELILTNLDIELLFDNYYVNDIEWVDGYIYNARKGYELTDEEFKTLSYQEILEKDGQGSLFYEYIKEFRQIKENSTGALRDIAKFMQNMLYGNFGKNIDGIIRLPYLNADGLVSYNEFNTGETRQEYVPIACFITSQCRYHLIKDIKANFDNFVYCDTDSMYLLDRGQTFDLRISDNLYGAYKIEKKIDRMKVLGSKRYIVEAYVMGKKDENGNPLHGLFVSCCGAPKEVKKKMTFENFEYNAEFDGKLQAKIVKGGKHLISTTYKIKA